MATPTVKSNNSSRNLGSYSLIKNSAGGNSLDTKGDNQVSPQKNTSLSPVGNKSSITLQVSTTNRTSPPSSSGYSSQCQSSNGRASVLSSASSAVAPPFQDLTSRRNVTVTAESPNDHTTTTTATINGGPNTKIYLQQQNSPIRSVITFENGVKHNTNAVPNKDILILNGFSSHADGKSSSKENVSLNNGKFKGNSEHAQSKAERPKSLYSPREKIKRGGERYHESAGNRMERRKCPSLEALHATTDISSIEAATKNKHTNSLNSNNIINENIHKRPSSSSSSSSLKTNGGNLVSTHHPNSHPPSTQPTCSDPMMNNTRILRSLSASPALPVRSKENLSYKNVLRNSPTTPPDAITPLNLHLEGIKNKFCGNPSSPTKSFDNFGGSYGNLYIEGMADADKFLSSNAQELEAKEKGAEEKGYERSSMDLCPYSSLSDLTVHFKSIAAQKILKGVSINSIDTLVEVNMAAAEKQNNCDVTIHTDFGMV